MLYSPPLYMEIMGNLTQTFIPNDVIQLSVMCGDLTDDNFES